MKKIFLSFVFCLISFQSFASEIIQELNGKYYVAPGSVYVASDAIYINFEGNFVPVQGISSDSNGIYILDHDCRMMYCLRCKQYHDSQSKCPNMK
jgi:hypothetical protein